MWSKVTEQDWYKEDPSIYDDMVASAANSLNCDIDDLYFTHSDEDFELVCNIENFGVGNVIYMGYQLFIAYNEGITSVFSKEDLTNKIV